MGIYPPIRIENSTAHLAQNSPSGVHITTGCRYFAAVLAQEVYEGRRFMAWAWLPFFALCAAAGALPIEVSQRIGIIVLATIWLILVARQAIPFRGMRQRRELMGQAIEIAAIKLIYARPDMETEYYLQARSIIRDDSSYKAMGFWPDIDSISPVGYTNDDALALVPDASILKMVALLKSVAPRAEAYVNANKDKIMSWVSLGDGSKGY